jgi:hypothetical protein
MHCSCNGLQDAATAVAMQLQTVNGFGRELKGPPIEESGFSEVEWMRLTVYSI